MIKSIYFNLLNLILIGKRMFQIRQTLFQKEIIKSTNSYQNTSIGIPVIGDFAIKKKTLKTKIYNYLRLDH